METRIKCNCSALITLITLSYHSQLPFENVCIAAKFSTEKLLLPLSHCHVSHCTCLHLFHIFHVFVYSGVLWSENISFHVEYPISKTTLLSLLFVSSMLYSWKQTPRHILYMLHTLVNKTDSDCRSLLSYSHLQNPSTDVSVAGLTFHPVLSVVICLTVWHSISATQKISKTLL